MNNESLPASPLGPLLAGLRVIELSAFVAAPLGGAALASFGAEVVRVDPPGGGIDIDRWPLHRGKSLYWAGLNQGKRSVTIDTRDPRGQAIVTRMIERAGVLLTNLPAHGWASYERLRQVRADLIMAVISGTRDGSAAVDYTVNAAVGFPWITGPEGWHGPVNHVLPAWDALTGYLVTAAILAAEIHRIRAGEGQLIEISLTDVALSVAGHLGFIAEAELNEEPRARYGNQLFGSFAREFETADRRHLIVVALTPRQWKSLVEATGIGTEVEALEHKRSLDLRREGDRFGAREEISSLLDPWFRTRMLAAAGEVLDKHGVIWSPYQTFKQLVREDRQRIRENPLFMEIEEPEIGGYLHAGSPVRFSSVPRSAAQRSPRLGEDTDDVLRSWLGFSNTDIDALIADGIVSCQPA